MIRTAPWSLKLVMGLTVAAVAVSAVVFFTRQSPDPKGLRNTTIDLATAPESELFTLEGMLPGDTATNLLVISNDGTETLRYSVRLSATNDDGLSLRDQLRLMVHTIDITTPASPCDDLDGARLYAGDLTSTEGRIIGDPASGQDGLAETGGDRVLVSGSSETLCFQISLPRETGNAFQAAATTAKLTVYAEQVRSN